MLQPTILIINNVSASSGIFCSVFVGIIGSLVAMFLGAYFVFKITKTGVIIKISKSRCINKKSDPIGEETTTVKIINKTPFSISFHKSISFYGHEEGEKEGYSQNSNGASYVIIPRFGEGKFYLPSKVDLPFEETESIIVKYSTIDMLNIFISKDISLEYREACKTRQP